MCNLHWCYTFCTWSALLSANQNQVILVMQIIKNLKELVANQAKWNALKKHHTCIVCFSFIYTRLRNLFSTLGQLSILARHTRQPAHTYMCNPMLGNWEVRLEFCQGWHKQEILNNIDLAKPKSGAMLLFF